MTLDEASERITELDTLIFKVETGQVPMSWEEYRTLQVEVEALMEGLAKNLSSLKGCSYEEAYEPRQKIRIFSRMGAMANRHLQLHPEACDKEDPLLIAAFHSGDDGNEINYEAFERFFEQFSYIFENCPKPPPEKPKGVFTRLFRAISSRFGGVPSHSVVEPGDPPPPPNTFDLSGMRQDLSAAQSDNREFYERELEPHLNRLEAKYGNNVPVSEMEGIQQLIEAKLVGINKEIQGIIDRGAKEGGTIEIAALRRTLEEAKATYTGPDREAFVDGLDRRLESLAAKYGSHIPLDDAYRIMQDLEGGRGFTP
jgi:hypothetical protein